MNPPYHRPPRLVRKDILRKESEERKVEWDKLSTMEKIDALDSKLGPNVGAKKQRARLKTQLENECKPIKKQATKKKNLDGLAWDAPGMEAPGRPGPND